MSDRNDVPRIDKLLTVDEAAPLMSMSVRHVRRLIAERRIAFHKLGRSVRLAASDIAEYISASRVEPITDEDVWRSTRRAA